jgi:hypothetical protein
MTCAEFLAGLGEEEATEEESARFGYGQVPLDWPCLVVDNITARRLYENLRSCGASFRYDSLCGDLGEMLRGEGEAIQASALMTGYLREKGFPDAEIELALAAARTAATAKGEQEFHDYPPFELAGEGDAQS